MKKGEDNVKGYKKLGYLLNFYVFNVMLNSKTEGEKLKTFYTALLQFIIVFFFTISAAASEEVTIVVEHWPPWEIAIDVEKQNVTEGLAIEVSKELFSRLGYEIKLITVPWKRAIKKIKDGESDIIPMISYNSERAKHMVFTDPVYIDPLILAYTIDEFKSFEWNKFEDLQLYIIGGALGFDYGKKWKEAVKKNGINIDVAPNDKLVMIKLIRGRYKFAIFYYSVAKNISTEIQGGEKIRFSSKPIDEEIFRFGISKKSFLSKEIEKINMVINKMKEDGTFKNILKEYYTEF